MLDILFKLISTNKVGNKVQGHHSNPLYSCLISHFINSFNFILILSIMNSLLKAAISLFERLKTTTSYCPNLLLLWVTLAFHLFD